MLFLLRHEQRNMSDQSFDSPLIQIGLNKVENTLSSQISKFNIDKTKVKYIEAHGTGTPVGDREELKSLSQIYKGCNNIDIGSIKSNLGHTEGASGIMSIIKCLLMYEFNTLFPNLNISL